MKAKIKSYANGILKNVSKAELIYWWILRILMIYGIIESLIFGDEYLGSNQPLQMFANLCGMFGYNFACLSPNSPY